MDRGSWWAMAHRVAKSRMQLKRPSRHAHMRGLGGKIHSQLANLFFSIININQSGFKNRTLKKEFTYILLHQIANT